MKTISDVCKEYPEFSLVIKAVVRRIGKGSIEDVNNHGIDSGFDGFIYYFDTVAFWRKYRKLILEMLKNDAENCTSGIVEMVQGFNCLMNGNIRNYSIDEIGRALYGNFDNEQYTIYNALAWYAAETVCRYFEE